MREFSAANGQWQTVKVMAKTKPGQRDKQRNIQVAKAGEMVDIVETGYDELK